MNLLGGEPKPRYIPGLGSSIVPKLINHAQIDSVITISEPDAVRGCYDLFNTNGLFMGGSTGSVFAAINQYFKGKSTIRKPNVAFVCADRGTSYLDTIYNAQWVKKFLPSLIQTEPDCMRLTGIRS